MKSMIKYAVTGLALAATVMTVVPAEARDHWRGRHNHDDAVAAGIAGLAIGAIVGGLASQPSRTYIDPPYQPTYRPVYPSYQPYPVYQAPRYRYVRPAHTYRGGIEPWTPAWYRACGQRYRSFDPSSGTFVGYDGRRHFCTFN